MPSSTIVHAAIFTIGAAIGAGLTASLSGRRRVHEHDSITSSGPIVGVDKKGVPGILQTRSVPGDILKYGNPGPTSDLLVRKVYVTGYDRRLRHPSWTAEHLTLASLLPETGGEKGDRSKSEFKEDESLPLQFRATLQNYFRSGYDRGHMVPAADAKQSQGAMDETFLLSNMAPQVGAGFNRHYWAYVEDWCRRLTSNFSDVYIFTVPLYLPKLESDGKWRVAYEVIGSPPNVSVPTHFAKVVLTSRPTSPRTPHIQEISTGAFVLPNASIPDNTPLEQFAMPVDAVERAAGLTIFSEDIKRESKYICATTSCQLLAKRFDDAQRNALSPSRPLSIPSASSN